MYNINKVSNLMPNFKKLLIINQKPVVFLI